MILKMEDSLAWAGVCKWHWVVAGNVCKKMHRKEKKCLTNGNVAVIIQRLRGQRTEYGGIAQLGERLNGIQEVSGSIPLISTTES